MGHDFGNELIEQAIFHIAKNKTAMALPSGFSSPLLRGGPDLSQAV